MLGSLSDALSTVQNELTKSVQKLRNSVQTTSAVERNSSEVIASFLKTQAGSNLLLKYQLNIETVKQMNDENIRLANLCSTRMGRAHQMWNERAEATLAFHDHLRTLSQTEKELTDLNSKISKLNRFCSQTELAITHLKALVIIGDTEADIAFMKNNLREEKAKKNNFLKFSNTVLDIGYSSLAVNLDERREQNQFPLEIGRLEEVALEEFLNSHENNV